jgi:peroxiredoxin Q/BCP
VWSREKFPFRGLPDPDHKIAKLFEQRWRLLGLGRQPSVVVIDRDGRMRWRHDGGQMWDIPANEEILSLLQGISTASA